MQPKSNTLLRSPDSDESKGKVVRFDPTLRRESKKQGKADSQKSLRFGKSPGGSKKLGKDFDQGSTLQFKAYKVIQIVVVALAFAYVMKSCIIR